MKDNKRRTSGSGAEENDNVQPAVYHGVRDSRVSRYRMLRTSGAHGTHRTQVCLWMMKLANGQVNGHLHELFHRQGKEFTIRIGARGPRS